MRFRVPQWLVNITHFSKLSGGQETAPARGELRPSSEGSPWVDGDPCRTKTPSGHSFHLKLGQLLARNTPQAECPFRPARMANKGSLLRIAVGAEPSSVGVRYPRAVVLGKRAAADVCPYAAPKEQQSEAQSEYLRHFQTPCWTHNPRVPKVFLVSGTNRDSRS